jgi:nucleoside 2-deoxyribosyltransferase
MHIYVAGPYSKFTIEDSATCPVEDNVARAAKWGAKVFAKGHTAIIPHTLTHLPAQHEDAPQDTGFWHDVTLDMLRRCDAILVLPLWYYSTGTLQEMVYAYRNGIPMYLASGSELPHGDHDILANDVRYHPPSGEIEILSNANRGLVATIIAGSEYEVGIPPLHPTETRSPVQVKAFQEVIQKLYRTHLKKNADYSPANILGTGEIGLVTRLWDKMARLMNLSGFDISVTEPAEYGGKREAMNEPLEDAYLDLSCYGIIGKLLRDGKWGR